MNRRRLSALLVTCAVLLGVSGFFRGDVAPQQRQSRTWADGAVVQVKLGDPTEQLGRTWG